MKLSLPIKLGIFVVLLFSVVIAICLLWTPVKIRYYASMLDSKKVEKQIEGINVLLKLGARGREAIIDKFHDGKEAGNILVDNWNNLNGAISIYDSHIEDDYTGTPLHIAARKNYLSLAILLIHRGANLNSKDECGLIPLHWAGYDISRHLIKKSDVNAKDEHGFTPLHLVVEPKKARLLLENGADINAIDGSGFSPLHRATSLANKDLVKFLLQKGAEVNTKSNRGETPFETAQDHKNKYGIKDYTEIISNLRAYGAKTEKELRKEPEKK